MDCPVYRTLDFTKSSGGEKTMIFAFCGGYLFGAIVGYVIAAILNSCKKDEEAADGKDL